MPMKDWTTADLLATVCGVGHNRMTSLHSRSSYMSRWRHWIGAWGSGELTTSKLAARESNRRSCLLCQGWTGHPSHS
jgi:hypothetical protein